MEKNKSDGGIYLVIVSKLNYIKISFRLPAVNLAQ
jgi:hypothetical protein